MNGEQDERKIYDYHPHRGIVFSRYQIAVALGTGSKKEGLKVHE